MYMLNFTTKNLPKIYLPFKIFYAKVLSMKTSNIKFSPVDIEARKGLVFKAGDTINVWSKILEEKTEKRGDKKKKTKKPRARRSKLYYIRTKAVKDIRSKMRSIANQEEEIEAETPIKEPAKVAE